MPDASDLALSLVVVIPAFNEAERIAETVTAVKGQTERLRDAGFTLTVLVVDDGSTDGTGDAARSAGADRVVSHRTNRGLGAAVRTGLLQAREMAADFAVKFDADLQHDPNDILAIIQPIVDGHADVVYGQRFERISYQMPFVRRLGNRVFTQLMRTLTGWPLRDSQPGIFAVNRLYLRCFYLPGDYNYTQQILLDAYHQGMRFDHVPVAFRERTTGRSFVSFKYPYKVAGLILFVLVGVRPMRVFAPIGGLFLTIAAAVFTWQFGQWLLGMTAKPIVSVNLVLGTGLFGLQTLFFGLLAELIVRRTRPTEQ